MPNPKSIWRAWKYTLGSYSDVKTRPYDNRIAVVRTTILLCYMMTNFFIVAGTVGLK